jgi:hypothetical protein
MFDHCVVVTVLSRHISVSKTLNPRVSCFSEFFFLRLLEDLMSIANLYILFTILPPIHLYYNLLTEVDQDLICLCMLVQFSELKRYSLESVPI